MRTCRIICWIVAASLLPVGWADAQTVVESVFSAPTGNYGDPANWSPPQVPNNTALVQYKVAIPAAEVTLDISPTISNLTLDSAEILAGGHALTVTGGAAGSFTLRGGAVIVEGNVTNTGTIELFDSVLDARSGVANFDAKTRTLTSGAFRLVFATLRFAGADIVRNSGTVQLWSGSKILDHNGNDALRHLAFNDAAGELELQIPTTVRTAGDFENAGRLLIAGDFSGVRAQLILPTGSRYLQTGGLTQLDGGALRGNVDVAGGVFSSRTLNPTRSSPLLRGQLSIGAAVLEPDNLYVEGPVTLSQQARFRIAGLSDGEVFFPAALESTSAVSIAGELEVGGPYRQFPVANANSYPIVRAPSVAGTFSNAPPGERISTNDGRGTVRVIYEPGQIRLTEYQRNPPASQLLNLSTRAAVRTGHEVTIAGFIIVGAEPKRVLLRGIGPSLAQHGISGALQDPTITLHDQRSAPVTNDNWKQTQDTEIRASGLAPADDREAAIVATLPPGAYTVIMRGVSNTTGVGLVEVYDLTPNSASKLANVSTRGFVDPDNVLIGGFISGGVGPGATEIVVRGMGPALENRVPGFLPDPTVELRDGDGTLLFFNDNLEDGQDNRDTVAPGFATVGLNAALGAVVPPGRYTAVVRAKPGQSGIALVEIFDLNR